MRGLYYCTAKLNRNYFIAAFAVFLCSIAAGSAVLAIAAQNRIDVSFAVLCATFLPIIPSAILSEFILRDLERNIKSGFLNFTLSSITHKSFVLSQLVINLSCTALGLVLGIIQLFIFGLAGGEDSVSAENFQFLTIIAILVGVFEWISFPVTLKLKSAEKASFAVGLVLGFGIIMPTIFFLKLYNIDIVEAFISTSALAIEAAAAIVIYFVVFVINIKLLKRGI